MFCSKGLNHLSHFDFDLCSDPVLTKPLCALKRITEGRGYPGFIAVHYVTSLPEVAVHCKVGHEDNGYGQTNMICRVGEDTFKKYLKIQILYTQTYIFTDRQY